MQFSPHGSVLRLDVPAPGDQITENLAKAARICGILQRLTSHDLRQGAAMDLYELGPGNSGGTVADYPLAAALGHSRRAFDSGITERYLEPIVKDNWSRRLNNKHDHPFDLATGPPFHKRPRLSSQALTDLCAEKGIDAKDIKARRKLAAAYRQASASTSVTYDTQKVTTEATTLDDEFTVDAEDEEIPMDTDDEEVSMDAEEIDELVEVADSAQIPQDEQLLQDNAFAVSDEELVELANSAEFSKNEQFLEDDAFAMSDKELLVCIGQEFDLGEEFRPEANRLMKFADGLHAAAYYDIQDPEEMSSINNIIGLIDGTSVEEQRPEVNLLDLFGSEAEDDIPDSNGGRSFVVPTSHKVYVEMYATINVV